TTGGNENQKSDPDEVPFRVDVEQLRCISKATIAHYDQLAEAYWDGTRDHDVSQNHLALLDAIEGDPPYSILDLGCGPGRDLHHFRTSFSYLGARRCGPGGIEGIRGYGTRLFRVRGSPSEFSGDGTTERPI